MSAPGRLLPIAEMMSLISDGPLVGDSGHRNFDVKPRAYEFANGCLRPLADIGTLICDPTLTPAGLPGEPP